MRFTNSIDGIQRANVRITIRLSAEDLAEIKAEAIANKEEWRTWLKWQAESGVRSALIRAREEHYE